MTLYEFNLLERDDKLSAVWNQGVFLDNYVTTKERCNLYAINKFFVEIEMHPVTNKILKINSFKTGYLLDKYSSLDF